MLARARARQRVTPCCLSRIYTYRGTTAPSSEVATTEARRRNEEIGVIAVVVVALLGWPDKGIHRAAECAYGCVRVCG